LGISDVGRPGSEIHVGSPSLESVLGRLGNGYPHLFMEFPALLFTVFAAGFLCGLPRRWAALPLLVGASYMTLGQSIQIGPFHFTVIRLLVAAGVLRVIMRRERMAGGWIALDWLMTGWALWALCCSGFHQDPSEALVSNLGLVYNGLGTYLLMRVFIRDGDDVLVICKIVIVLLAPVALEMIIENITGSNAFSIFGGVPAESEIRNGKIRAQGPFAHSILAGTVGAVSLPMALQFVRKNRAFALFGLMITGSIVMASRSSGPILTTAAVLMALALWRVRRYMRTIRWGAVIAIFGLALIMKAPVYYLLSRIDLTGGSTGWHRSALIEAAITHWDEWWIGGTDYTRNWMPTGVAWNEHHTDITNHYIKMGVIGGAPLMLFFIATLVSGFLAVGKVLRLGKRAFIERSFLAWTLGSMLFGHATTFLSVSYFDQSVVFLYVTLAAIGSVYAATRRLDARMKGFVECSRQTVALAA